MARSTRALRELWRDYECAEAKMVVVPFGPDRIRVAPPTAPAWSALAAVLEHHQYAIRTADTDSYNCRATKAGTAKSLHAFGIALDVNWTTNPYRDHQGERAVRWSVRPSQAARAEDVRLGVADTDLTPAAVADVARIATTEGKRVFEWGGSWKTLKDCMHFEIDLSPAELAKGIDPATIVGTATPRPSDAAPAPITGRTLERCTVIARGGLNLRGGPGTSFPVLRTCPEGAELSVVARTGAWAQVDLGGDGAADGYVSAGFLRPVAAVGPSVLPLLTAERVQRILPAATSAAIAANLPHVTAALAAESLSDRPMVLMALATIRAETETFQPLSEGESRLNTVTRPFDVYEAGGTRGVALGNVAAGDGARFRGRGYVQLTGRGNYARIGGQIGVDLVAEPERANDPATAGRVIARFLKNAETPLRRALGTGDLATARRLVNGGSHGLDRFEDSYRRGEAAIPA